MMNNTDYSIKNVNETITVKGWVSKKRNLGGLIFIDLRDKSGIIQLVIKPENKCYNVADSLGREFVISVTGTIEKAKLVTLKQALDNLHPKKVDLSAVVTK